MNKTKALAQPGLSIGPAEVKRKTSKRVEPYRTAWELSQFRTGKIWREKDHKVLIWAIRQALEGGDPMMLGYDPDNERCF